MGKPRLHGRDHRPGGADALTSGNTAAGYQLAADGAGGTRWDAPTPPSSGIDFDTDPQTGGWLLVTTTSTHTSGSSNGIQLKSTGGNILIDGNADVTILSGDDVTITPGETIQLVAAGAGISRVESEGVLFVGSNNDQAAFSAKHRVGIASAENETVVFLPSLVGTPSDYSFIVGIAPASPFFRVDNDGSVHILTGTSVVADL